MFRISLVELDDPRVLAETRSGTENGSLIIDDDISKSTLFGVFKLSEMSPVIEFEDLGDISISLVSNQFVVIAVAVIGVSIFELSFEETLLLQFAPAFLLFVTASCLSIFFSDRLGSTDL